MLRIRKAPAITYQPQNIPAFSRVPDFSKFLHKNKKIHASARIALTKCVVTFDRLSKNIHSLFFSFCPAEAGNNGIEQKGEMPLQKYGGFPMESYDPDPLAAVHR